MSRREWFSLLLFAALALLFCGRSLTSRDVYYYGDIGSAHFAFHTAIARQVRAGHWPLWTDQIFGGMPVLAEGQAGPYYPLNVLYYLPGLPLTTALKLSVCLHVFLALLFTYLLARRLGLEVWPARLAAVAFGLSGYLVARVIHQNVHHAAVWLPLILCCAAAAQQQPARARRFAWLLLAGAAYGIQALTFWPPASFYTLLAVLGFCLFAPGPPRPIAARVGDCALVAAVGLLLAAAQILPTAELLALSPRAGSHGYAYLTELSLPLRHLATLLLPNLFGSPATDDYWGAPNFWEFCGFFGVLPLLLAVPALTARSRRPAARFWAGLAAFALFMALGSANPLYHLLPYVPGFNLFKAPARYLLVSALSLAMLAGYGLQALLDGPETDRRARRRFTGVCLGLGLASALLAASAILLRGPIERAAATVMLPQLAGAEGRVRPPAYYAQQFHLKWSAYYGHRTEDLAFLAALALAAWFVVWYRCRGGAAAGSSGDSGAPVSAAALRRLGPACGPVMLALVVLELFRFGYGYQPLIDPSYYSSPPATARAMAADARARAPGEPDAPRIYRAWRAGTAGWEREVRAGHSGWAGPKQFEFQLLEALPWNHSIYDPNGMRLLDGGTAVPPGRTGPLANWAESALDHPGSAPAREAVAALGALNTGYLVSPLDLRPAGGVPIFATGGLTLYRLPNARPRAFLAALACAPDPDGPLATFLRLAAQAPDRIMVEPGFPEMVLRPQREPAPMNPAALRLAETPIQAGESARVTRSDPSDAGRIEIDATPGTSRLLVLLERPYPGWECRIDGRRAPVLRAGYLGMGVVLPPGRHHVVFRFRSLSARVGLLISGITLASLCAALAAVLRNASGRGGSGT